MVVRLSISSDYNFNQSNNNWSILENFGSYYIERYSEIKWWLLSQILNLKQGNYAKNEKRETFFSFAEGKEITIFYRYCRSTQKPL